MNDPSPPVLEQFTQVIIENLIPLLAAILSMHATYCRLSSPESHRVPQQAKLPLDDAIETAGQVLSVFVFDLDLTVHDADAVG